MFAFNLASSLLNAIDPKADPCDNFFQFACGMWRKKQVIPEDKSITGVFYQVDDSVDIILKCRLQLTITMFATIILLTNLHNLDGLLYLLYKCW